MTAVTARSVTSLGHARGSSPWSTWSAAALALVAAVVLLRRVDTPVPVTLAYAAAWVVVVTLPGTVVWRAVRAHALDLGRTAEESPLHTGDARDRDLRSEPGHGRGPFLGSFVEDVALGSALGLAVQVLLGLVLAPLGWGAWANLWAPVTLVACAVHPRLRAAVRAAPHRRSSPGDAWTTAAAVAAASLWVTATSFATNPVRYVDGSGLGARMAPLATYIDMPYHQSLAAGVHRFWPLVYPYLYDEPLHYHFLAYEHLASMSEATGIDLGWVVYRLHTLPLVALTLVLVAALAVRVSRLPAAGPLAAVLAALGAALSPYGWTAQPFFSPGVLTYSTFRSPTHALGLCLLLATLLVTTMLLERWTPATRRTVLPVLVVLALAAGGTKSTVLPVVACGAGLVLLVGLLRRRPWWRPAAAVVAVAAAAFVVVALTVTGTSTDRVQVLPGALLDHLPVAAAAGLPAGVAGASALVLVLALAAWLPAGAGGLLLLGGERGPAVWLLLGTAVAGICAALLTSANGVSELYFLYIAWPVLPVLSAWGLASRLPHRVPLTTALVGGAAAALVLSRTGTSTAPAPATSVRTAAAVLLPAWPALAGLLVGAAVVAWVTARTRAGTSTRRLAVPLLVAAVVGSSLGVRAEVVLAAVPALGRPADAQAEGVVFPEDLATTALWLRDASRPTDVVATNAHCYGGPESCDARHFIVSALTERRVLVEGWAYPDGGDRGRPWSRTAPFWDAERYAQNEAVFTAPTPEAVALLAEEYGVRWLLVDRSVYRESPALRDVARLVHETDGYAVYAIG